MGIGCLESNVKLNDTRQLIIMLKKVFSNTELKLVISCLQKLKEAQDGLRDIQNVLRSLKLAFFRDQKIPRNTD